MNTEYSIHIDSVVDLVVALECEANRAQTEGMYSVASRQRALALHIENAVHHLARHQPDGYRLDVTLDFHFKADVNPVLKPEYR
jgi:hypothetical protein